ncbi:MAG: SDR family oxidoreductase [Polyangiaceae bacterium]
MMHLFHRSRPIRVAGSCVLVTGAGRGIGLATAKRLVASGARVGLGDLDAETAHAAARALGERAFSAHLDVRDPASFAAFVAEGEARMGTIDVLVANAGVMPLGPFVDEPDAVSRLTLDVNVWGLVVGLRAVLPGMLARGHGHVVNVASMAGKVPLPGMAVYNASKFAAVGLSEAVRREVSGSGVTVSCVMPSAVRTELASGVPLDRGMPTVEPEEVARAIVGTFHSRAPEVPVPRVLAGWDALNALVPRAFVDAALRALGDRRAIEELDPEGRRSYAARVARHAAR